MATQQTFAIEELRKMVKAFDNVSESFNMRHTLPELITIWRAWKACEWDYYPDQWSHSQVRAALLGWVPKFTDDGKPARPTVRILARKVRV